MCATGTWNLPVSLMPGWCRFQVTLTMRESMSCTVLSRKRVNSLPLSSAKRAVVRASFRSSVVAPSASAHPVRTPSRYRVQILDGFPEPSCFLHGSSSRIPDLLPALFFLAALRHFARETRLPALSGLRHWPPDAPTNSGGWVLPPGEAALSRPDAQKTRTSPLSPTRGGMRLPHSIKWPSLACHYGYEAIKPASPPMCKSVCDSQVSVLSQQPARFRVKRPSVATLGGLVLVYACGYWSRPAST